MGLRTEAQVQEVVDARLRGIWERTRRSAGNPPATVPGAGYSNLAWHFLDPNPEQQALWGSEQAKYGRFTTATGPTLQAYSSNTSVNLSIERLALVYGEVNRDGYLLHKADLDTEISQKWGHLAACHRQRLAPIGRNPLQFKPRHRHSSLSRFVCNFVRDVAYEMPGGLVGAELEMGSAHRSGYSGHEVVYQEPDERIVRLDGKSYTVRDARGVQSLEYVHPRDFRWDPVRRRMLLDAGGARYVDPFKDPSGRETRKLILHKTGEGERDPHQRGYAFATNLYYMLSHQSLAKWAVCLELFGVNTPYMIYGGSDDGSAFADDADVGDAIEFITAIGRGIPAILQRKFGELKQTETPQGLDAHGQHGAILAYMGAETAKAVAGQVLAQEAPGGGASYALANVHQDTGEGVQVIDARLEADTMTHQFARYIVFENARQIAEATGATPGEVRKHVPIAYRIVDRRQDPQVRLAMFISASTPKDQGGLGLTIDPEQIAEECNFRLIEGDAVPAETDDKSGDDPPDPEKKSHEHVDRARRDAKWEEDKHPRAGDGKFGSGGGSPAAEHAEQNKQHAATAKEAADKAATSNDIDEIRAETAKAKDAAKKAAQTAKEAFDKDPKSMEAMHASVHAVNAQMAAEQAEHHEAVAETFAREAAGPLKEVAQYLRQTHTQVSDGLEKAKIEHETAQKALAKAKTPKATAKAQDAIAEAKFKVSALEDYGAGLRKQFDDHGRSAAEKIHEHVEQSLIGHRLIGAADKDGVSAGSHGVDFHISPGLHPSKYGKAAKTIEKMVGHDSDLQAALAKNKTTLLPIKAGGHFLDHEPFKGLDEAEFGRALGVAGTAHDGRSYLAAGEDDTATLTHELGHAVHDAIEAKIDAGIRRAHQDALDGKAQFPSAYGATDHYENWAESTEAWWGCEEHDRDWVKKNAPRMAKLLTSVYGDRP